MRKQTKLVKIKLIAFGIAALITMTLVQGAFADDWPMFHHDIEHTGVSTEKVEPPFSLLWTFHSPSGRYFTTSPTVSSGTVYVGSEDSNVYALDAVTGNLKWNYTTENSIESSPAVSGSVVYIGSHDGLYALDAATGNLNWKYNTGDEVGSSPTVTGGIVYVGSRDGNVYALDETTGNLNWKYKTGGFVDSSPAVSNGMVYIGSRDNNVYALDIAGNLKWKYTAGILNGVTAGIVSSPAVSGGMVYVGARDGNVYAFDAVTGNLNWKFETGELIESSPAVSGGVVYIGSFDYVYALDAMSGVLKWDAEITKGDLVDSSPAISGDVVYVRATDNNLYALDTATGALKGTYKTGSGEEGIVTSSPAVSGGVIYSGSGDGVYALTPTLPQGSISGTKFEDINANGIRDPGETGLAGWNITIKNTIDNTNVQTITDNNGNYSFTGLTAGMYTIDETQKDSWTQTTPANGTYIVTITSGTVITGKDFGNFHSILESLNTNVIDLRKLGEINNDGIENSFLAKVNAAMISRNKGQPDVVLNQLQALLNEIKAQSNKHVTPNAVNLLSTEVRYVMKAS